MAESKQKCLNRIVGDTRIGEFWFREKWSRIYFFFTWKAKNQPILSINAVSPGKAKRRILAALWRSPVLRILQTENLKRKKPVGLTGGNLFLLVHILTPDLSSVALAKEEGSNFTGNKVDLFTSDCKERFHKQGKRRFEWRAAVTAWRCEVEPDGSVKWSLPSSPLRATPWQVRLRYFFCLWKKAKKMVAGPRIELGTRGFSVPCSTDWANLPHSPFYLGMCIIYTTFCDLSNRFGRFFDFFWLFSWKWS